MGLPAAKYAFFLVLGAVQTKPIHFCFGSWLQLYHIPYQWVLLCDSILSMVVSSLMAALQPGGKALGKLGET